MQNRKLFCDFPRPFTEESNVPLLVKELVNPAFTWVCDNFGTPANVTYSFGQVLWDDTLTHRTPAYVNRQIGLDLLHYHIQERVRTVFQNIQFGGNIQFSDSIVDGIGSFSQIPIYSFKFDYSTTSVNVSGYGSISDVAGFASPPYFIDPMVFPEAKYGRSSAGIGLNIDGYHPAVQLQIITHEGLHEVGLKHPFQPPFSVIQNFKKLSTYTALSYEMAKVKNIRIYTISPMPADYESLAFIYGSNLNANAGDTIYDVSTFTPYLESGINFRTISCIPPDASGIDTIRAIGYLDVEVNLRPYGFSAVHYPSNYFRASNTMYFTMPGPLPSIENYYGSIHHNLVIMNSLNNTINIEYAKTAKLVVDPLNCGHDVVIGFNPSRGDKIIVERLDTDPEPVIHFKRSSTASIIEFSQEHKIELKDVKLNSLRTEHVEIRKAEPDIRAIEPGPFKLMDESPHHLPSNYFSIETINDIFTSIDERTRQELHKIYIQYKEATQHSALVTILDKSSLAILRNRFKFTEKELKHIELLLQFIMFYQNGSLLSACIGLGINRINKFIGLNSNDLLIVHCVISELFTSWLKGQNNFTIPFEQKIVNTIFSTIGACTGSFCASRLWNYAANTRFAKFIKPAPKITQTKKML